MSSQVMALIPARGGSKGVPRKNIRLLLGKPLIAYSIEHAQASAHINRVIVSTDDAGIAAIARQWGAEVPFMRPAEYAQDLSPDIDVFRHALIWLAEHEGYQPELVVHLRPTGPVRRVELIDQAISQILAHPEADALRSVSQPIQTPYKMWRMDDDGYLQPLLQVDGLPDCQSMPRQILPQVWWQNGYVDVIRPRAILEMNSMTGQRVLPFVVNEPIYEIDYPDSIPIVEATLKRLGKGERLQLEDDDAERYPV
jgi:CMP-N,N'-diacetyllegionaminic acid synthase